MDNIKTSCDTCLVRFSSYTEYIQHRKDCVTKKRSMIEPTEIIPTGIMYTRELNIEKAKHISTNRFPIGSQVMVLNGDVGNRGIVKSLSDDTVAVKMLNNKILNVNETDLRLAWYVSVRTEVKIDHVCLDPNRYQNNDEKISLAKQRAVDPNNVILIENPPIEEIPRAKEEEVPEEPSETREKATPEQRKEQVDPEEPKNTVSSIPSSVILKMLKSRANAKVVKDKGAASSEVPPKSSLAAFMAKSKEPTLLSLIKNDEWKQALGPCFRSKQTAKIDKWVTSIYSGEETIYPKKKNLFEALNLTPLSNVKVVILGQDPYHGPNQAHGLSFSVENSSPPPSLVNVFKELTTEGFSTPAHGGNLTSWATCGVLLLNTSLTVVKGRPGSHANEWLNITSAIIRIVSETQKNVVFILWGKHALNAVISNALVDETKHKIISAGHPSPMNTLGTFSGCKCFTKANSFLVSKGVKPVNWSL